MKAEMEAEMAAPLEGSIITMGHPSPHPSHTEIQHEDCPGQAAKQ